MRPAHRLFQTIQILRRERRPITAAAIAAELEISQRTVYRDIATLIGQRVPIRGEAGIGYVLDGGFDLPPLMLTEDEIEAAVLGAQWVAASGDKVLARAAQNLIAKIEAAIPERLRSFITEPTAGTPLARNMAEDGLDLVRTRASIRAGRKMTIRYRDGKGGETERTVWPVIVGFFDKVRILAAWCELRRDFRSFRTDRIADAVFLDDKYPERPAILQARWRKTLHPPA